MKEFGGVKSLIMVLVLLMAVACAKKSVYEPGAAAGEEGVPGTDSSATVPRFPGVGEQEITSQGDYATKQGFQGMGVEVSGLERIFFEFDRYTLTDQARQILSRNAFFVQAHPNMKIIVEGHCDERGSDEYNMALGEKRARAVQNYLHTLGVPAERMRAISYGEEIPLDRGGTEAAWAKNRRVEFKEDR